LLLDEPTNGLDPAGREDMLDLVRTVSHGGGLSVLVSSHVLPDIERVCDRVIVVMKGQLRAAGTIADLKKLAGHPVDVELKELNPAFNRALIEDGMTVLPGARTTIRVQANASPAEIHLRVQRIARTTKTQVRGFRVAERSLEEAFLEVLHA
jgi:ABC-2 type transport system ATP-binding protein